MTSLRSAPSGPRLAFVGRRAELDQLYAAWEAVCTGRGGIVLLAGEPGIGKTRIAEELAAHALEHGAGVLWGRCYEGGGAPAFWPWIQILRTYLRAFGSASLAHEMLFTTAELARLVPEFGVIVPPGAASSPFDDEEARFRLFDSVTTFFIHAAQAQPMLLLLDDLHWADQPSLLLLQFMAQALQSSPILIVGAYRDVEIGRDHALAKTVAELSRLRACLSIYLDGLPPHDVAHFIDQYIGHAPSAGLVDLVAAGSAGNPFFVMELTHLLARSGVEYTPSLTVPPNVRTVIRQRLNRLSSVCNRVLDAAAVFGREFTLPGLIRLDLSTREPVLAALDEAINTRLIMVHPGNPGRFRFVHALVRETLYDEMPSLERMRLHLKIGAMLEDFYSSSDDTHLDELSYHFAQAAPLSGHEKATEYCVRAGERNMRLLAYEAACADFERALQLLLLAEQAEPAQRCGLLLALGQAQTRSGETAKAQATFADAAVIARQMNRPEYLARAALGFAGEVVTPGLANQRVMTLLTEALAVLGDSDSDLRVHLLGRLAMEYRYAPFEGLREQLSREAVAVARRLARHTTLVFALNARHFAILGPDTLEQRTAISLELAQLAQATGDQELALQSLPWRLADLLDLGHIHAADDEIATAARLADELGRPLYRWYTGVFRALRALMNGQFAAAEQLANDAHTLGRWVQPGAAGVYYSAQMYMLRREQGRIQEVEQPLLDIMAQYPAMPVIPCMLSVVYWQVGRSTEAYALLVRLCADRAAAIPKDQLWLGALAALAEVASGLSDHTCAATLYELLLPYADRNVVVGVPICFGAAAAYLGCLAAALQRWPEASHHFHAALAMNERLGNRPHLARTQYCYAAMLLEQGNRGGEEAARMLDQAAATAAELGMAHLARLIEPLLDQAQRQGRPAYPDKLTPREVDVLQLVAAGRSNKEIAAALSISEPTVERHITNLYAKIGARSRADATAYALRKGLA